MKTFLFLLIILPMSALAEIPAENVSLEDQMKTLDINNRAPVAVTKEKLYSVQNRFLELKNKSEVTVGIAQNLTSDSFLQTQDVHLNYRFHFNNRWSLGLSQSFIQNQFSSSGNYLLTKEGVAPDVAYARNIRDLTAEYNIFYGKFRLSMDQVLYFDLYGAIGVGQAELNTGTKNAAVADAGLVFWFGKSGSARLGVKDYYYNEPHILNTVTTHNLYTHLDAGYLF